MLTSHPIVGKSFAEFVADDEEDGLWVGLLCAVWTLKKKKKTG